MTHVSDFFKLNVSSDSMSASIDLVDGKLPEHSVITIQQLKNFLIDNDIIYGHLDEVIERITTDVTKVQFPITIAKGLPADNGINGDIWYFYNHEEDEDKSHKRNFRDIMKIPSVEKGDKIARVIAPTTGKKGLNICGKPVVPIPGKPMKVKAGKNVLFVKEENTFYANESGQLSIDEKKIHIYPLYEVNGDLSLKTGNINFVGSITIRGNVPTGYKVEAEGDIKIFGLVEAATIKAGGSIYISEGFVGLRKGMLQARNDIRVSYINQGNIKAGGDLIVDNSIIHSHCVATENIYCRSGNVIGGTISAGKMIDLKNVGNKLDTKTKIALAINKKDQEQEKFLQNKKKELEETKQKLQLIGEQLNNKKELGKGLNQKERILLLKQRRSLELTDKQLDEVHDELNELQVIISDHQEMKLIVRGSIYPNVELSLGKYKRRIDTVHQFVQILLVHQEISIQSL